MSEKEYRTKQKALVEELLKNAKGRHMTAEQVCRALEENGTPVGLSTVYRSLERLCESGIVRRYVTGAKGSACYQYRETECRHFHLKCNRCETLFHADCEFLNRLSEHVEQEHGFRIDHSNTVFYGLCAACLRSEKKAAVKNDLLLCEAEHEPKGEKTE